MSTPVGLSTLVKFDLLNIAKKSEEYIEKYADKIKIKIYHSDGSTKELTVNDLPYDESSSSPNKFFIVENHRYHLVIRHHRDHNDISCPERLTITLPVNTFLIIFAVVENLNWNVGLPDWGTGLINGAGMIMYFVSANFEDALIETCGRYTSNNNEHANISLYIYLIEEG